MPPSAIRFERLCDSEYRNAEGPIQIQIISAQDAAEFEPTFRDRIAEAWEDGRGNAVYV